MSDLKGVQWMALGMAADISIYLVAGDIPQTNLTAEPLGDYSFCQFALIGSELWIYYSGRVCY